MRLYTLISTALIAFSLGSIGTWKYGFQAGATPPLPAGAKASALVVVWSDNRMEAHLNGDAHLMGRYLCPRGNCP